MPDETKTADRYEEFLELFARDRGRLFAYVYSLLPHHADAEDVFQRCSVLLWRKFEQFERDKDFFSWACGVAFYEVRNFLRSANRDRLQFDPDLISQLAEQRRETLSDADERLEALRGCVQSLKPADRELIGSVYRGDMPLTELAKASGMALQTLYNRLSLIRHRLLDCVQRKLSMGGQSP